MPISNLSSGLRPGVCTSTTRPTNPYEGFLIYETDTNRVLVWDNAAWVMIADTDTPPGLQKITSASATSGATLSVNDCFSSDFSNYRILIDNFQPATAGQGLNLRLRVNGVDADGNDYYGGWVGAYADGSSTATAQNGANLLGTGMYNSANTIPLGTSSIDIFGPNRAERTYFSINAILYNSQFGGRSGFGEHNLTTAYTGFTLLPGSGNFLNVRVVVYGYRN